MHELTKARFLQKHHSSTAKYKLLYCSTYDNVLGEHLGNLQCWRCYRLYFLCDNARVPLPIVALPARLIVQYLAYCMLHHASIALRTLYAFDKAHDLIHILQGY